MHNPTREEYERLIQQLMEIFNFDEFDAVYLAHTSYDYYYGLIRQLNTIFESVELTKKILSDLKDI